MTIRLLLACLCLSFPLLLSLRAAQKPSPLVANGAETARNDVTAKIQEKIDKGAHAAADFAPELKKLDEYAARYADYPELAADFAMVKAALFLDGLEDRAEGRKLLAAVTRNYAGTPAAEQAARAIDVVDRTEKRNVADEELIPLVQQISAKADAGTHNVAAFAAELAKLDALIAKYADNREAAGNVALAKAMFYVRVVDQPAEGRKQLLAVTTNYRDTLAALAAQESLDAPDESAKR